jgi:tRNA-Thr(GGU) m(6)t(6)A37 methyltransferase TsaA
MTAAPELRPGEVTTDARPGEDATVGFIGRIHTPFRTRADCPRQGSPDGPVCEIEVFGPWVPALAGIETYARLEVLYWLDRARRDLLIQNPGRDGTLFGTFALRSPQRPNPIGSSVVLLEAVDGDRLRVRGLDCLDGTPLLDIKPYRGEFTPKAAPKYGAWGASRPSEMGE